MEYRYNPRAILKKIQTILKYRTSFDGFSQIPDLEKMQADDSSAVYFLCC
ncbi:MAG: hypothetical protein IJ566_03565 [Cardiobacteriaceae bacterium]|nr:hypothetical protein [Cardiobacteriaceae bacterium]